MSKKKEALPQVACTRCGQSEPAVTIQWRYKTPGVKHIVCNECQQAEISRKHYENNKDAYRERVKSRRAAAQVAINTFVVTQSCGDCGESRPPALILEPVASSVPQVSTLASRGVSNTSDALQSFSSTLSQQYAVRCLNCQAARRAAFEQR